MTNGEKVLQNEGVDLFVASPLMIEIDESEQDFSVLDKTLEVADKQVTP
jgi:hypothetical protein